MSFSCYIEIEGKCGWIIGGGGGGGGGAKGYVGPPSQIIWGGGWPPLFLRLWFNRITFVIIWYFWLNTFVGVANSVEPDQDLHSLSQHFCKRR